MKKLKLFLMLFVCLSTMCLSTACSNDDDEGQISDPASMIAGTYVGKGQLEMVGLSGMPIEEYQGMKIYVTKSSNEFVILTPYSADGSPFFSSGSGDVFQITQTVNGDYLLTSTNIPNARVSITKSKDLSYYYPYVSVGGESGYALSFTGKKQ
ncbi:MAG: hypothetical protein HDS65_06885 [Bacteroidales bacterium]|nr:hypothetical protein [Bacteroidales bacterium]